MSLPIRYSIRNALVRRASALLTALGIAMTVAVFTGIFALREGLEDIYRPRGRDDLAVYLRDGATSEGESGITREQVQILTKERPEVMRENGRPLAAAETYLAVFMDKIGGGRTNVPIRGVQDMTLRLHGDPLHVIEGRALQFGSNEIMIGKPLLGRIEGCQLGDTIKLNVTPFEVVGVFELPGAQGGEIWVDVERMMTALHQRVFQRVIARVDPATDYLRLNQALADDPRLPIKVSSERDYLAQQTTGLGTALAALAVLLTAIMGTAATLGAVNTMLASVAARVHEIGILLAIGYPGRSIFFAFLIESLVVGVLGGVLGMLLVLPLDGIETGAMNYNTFTDVSFQFRVTPTWLAISFFLACGLGVLGGVIPAALAARRKPVDALRRG